MVRVTVGAPVRPQLEPRLAPAGRHVLGVEDLGERLRVDRVVESPLAADGPDRRQIQTLACHHCPPFGSGAGAPAGTGGAFSSLVMSITSMWCERSSGSITTAVRPPAKAIHSG